MRMTLSTAPHQGFRSLGRLGSDCLHFHWRTVRCPMAGTEGESGQWSTGRMEEASACGAQDTKEPRPDVESLGEPGVVRTSDMRAAGGWTEWCESPGAWNRASRQTHARGTRPKEPGVDRTPIPDSSSGRSGQALVPLFFFVPHPFACFFLLLVPPSPLAVALQ